MEIRLDTTLERDIDPLIMEEFVKRMIHQIENYSGEDAKAQLQ